MSPDQSDDKTVFVLSGRKKNLELIRKVLEDEHFQVVDTKELKKVDNKINDFTIEAALVDITGYGKQIWNTCETLRKKDIPFIIISRRESRQLKQAGKQYGAEKTMDKPLLIEELIESLRYLIT